MKKMWATKHRPKTLDTYIFNNPTIKKAIEHYVSDGSFPHLMLYGSQGTGKTSIAYLLKSLFNIDDVDFMVFNASMANSVNDVREKISGFVKTQALDTFKVVFLDECDRMSPEALDALKSLIEEYDENARFIAVANTIHKFTEPFLDRFTMFKFEPLEEEELLLQSAKILKKEGIKNPDFDILEKFVKESRGSFRKLLNRLEHACLSGTLEDVEALDENFEVKASAMMLIGEGKWEEARDAITGILSDSDIAEAYRFFYDNLKEVDKFNDDKKWRIAIVTIADYLYKHEFVADKEINLAACLIKLSEI